MIRHLLYCQRLAVAYYGFALDAANLAHPRLSRNWGFILWCGKIVCEKDLKIKGYT